MYAFIYDYLSDWVCCNRQRVDFETHIRRRIKRQSNGYKHSVARTNHDFTTYYCKIYCWSKSNEHISKYRTHQVENIYILCVTNKHIKILPTNKNRSVGANRWELFFLVFWELSYGKSF